jgi:predicted phage terminase large subunit-like protein
MVLQRLEKEADRRAEIIDLEGSLVEFVEAAWPFIDTSEYEPCWAIDALCDHLEAVTLGHISKLLVNYPPRCAKTTVASVCWQAWTWARREQSFRSGAGVRFLCGSYNHSLALQNSNKTRRLLLSPFYQQRWGKKVVICEDQNTKEQFDLTAGGSRIATSVGGSLLGIGGDIICVDDPHNVTDVESEVERETVKNWWSEISSTRLNDPKQSAIVCVMQRLHESDCTGLILSGEDSWTHLMLPMRHDTQRHCVTVLKWDENGKPEEVFEDPRTEEGELMWPERFGEREVKALENSLGPYFAAGRLQQAPAPKGGGIFDRSWWKLWDPPRGPNGEQLFPTLHHVIGSLDSAFTTKQQNDPSGFTAWGVFTHPQDGQRRIMLVGAWRKHLAFSADRELIKWRETEINNYQYGYKLWVQRTQQHWGLMEWLQYSCRRYKVDKLLIEAKASGISAAQEARARFGRENFAIQLCPVKGDKVARAYAAQPTFSQGLVYAPAKDWAEEVITEMSLFPHGKRDDLTDSATQAISYLRGIGLAQTEDEARAEDDERVSHRPRPRPLYPV